MPLSCDTLLFTNPKKRFELMTGAAAPAPFIRIPPSWVVVLLETTCRVPPLTFALVLKA